MTFKRNEFHAITIQNYDPVDKPERQEKQPLN